VLQFVAQRLVRSVLVLLVVSFIVFVLTSFAPGDPVLIMLGQNATPEAAANLRSELHLDQPLPIRYINYIGDALHGDFGRSYHSQRPVSEELLRAYPATMQLAFTTLAFSVLVAIPVGVISAAKQHSPLDNFARVVVLLGSSLPVFWIAILLIYLFALRLGWFPATGRDSWNSVVLPAISLSTYSVAMLARMTRSGLLEVLGSDYIRTARAKGLLRARILFRHALPNSLILLITIVGLQFGHLLGGAAITETVFAWPGVGQVMVQAVFSRDYPIITGGVLMVATSFVAVNFLVDVLYTVIDPRLRSATS
jgi:peptide/nickel transport system permease protein